MTVARPSARALPVHRYHGDSRLEQLSADLVGVRNRVLDHGDIVTPGMDLRTALSLGTAGGTGPAGKVIRFSEGEWTWNAEIIEITRSNLTIIGSGGGTVFRRASSVTGATNRELLLLTGNNIRLIGIDFDEAGLSGCEAVYIGGDNCTVRECNFIDCYGALRLVNGCSHADVSHNLVTSYQNTGGMAIRLDGGATRAIVSHNRFLTQTTGAGSNIYAVDAATYCSFVGNVGAGTAGAGFTLDYRGIDNHVAAGNQDATNVR